jgi:hypothetical protein
MSTIAIGVAPRIGIFIISNNIDARNISCNVITESDKIETKMYKNMFSLCIMVLIETIDIRKWEIVAMLSISNLQPNTGEHNIIPYRV